MATLVSSLVGADKLKFDVVRLKNGNTILGMMVKESLTEITFQSILRPPGKPTVVILDVIQKNEIEGIDHIEPSEREALAAWLKELDPAGKTEKIQMENLGLKKTPWPTGGEAQAYRSLFFELVSHTQENITRRAAVRLEQVYHAFARALPPRRPNGQPTTVLLFRSLPEYHAFLKQNGGDILNPAFFDPGHNQIVCASDLERLGEELENARQLHQQWRQELTTEESELSQLYRGKIPAAFLKKNQDDRQRIDQAETRNDQKFGAATQQLFQTLYHEAFHAYLVNFVYQPEETDVPRWLNEGLAQIFESAVVEAGDLRIGHADEKRLDQWKGKARRGEFGDLKELLHSGPSQFVVAHDSGRRNSDIHYLNSWALAYYLTFQRKLLGTPALDRYVRALKGGSDPVLAFQKLTGQQLPEFETQFHQFLINLKPDGSTLR